MQCRAGKNAISAPNTETQHANIPTGECACAAMAGKQNKPLQMPIMPKTAAQPLRARRAFMNQAGVPSCLWGAIP